MDLSPSIVGLKVRRRPVTPLKTKRVVAEKYLVRQFHGAQQTLGNGQLGNASRIPGAENPADGLTKVKSDMAPLLPLLQSETCRP